MSHRNGDRARADRQWKSEDSYQSPHPGIGARGRKERHERRAGGGTDRLNPQELNDIVRYLTTLR